MLNKQIDVKVGSSGKDFPVLPADKYQVQISDVNEVEAVSSFTGEKELLLNFEFTILDNKDHEVENSDGEKVIESIRGRRLWKRMRPSLNDGKKGKSSWLYKMLCAVEKKSEDQEYFAEAAKNPDSLIGQQLCTMVNVAPGRDGKLWNNVIDFSKADKELTPFETAVEDLDQDELDKLFAGKEEKK